MQMIQIPLEEYSNMIKSIELLSNNELIGKLNMIIDTVYTNKLGLFMGDYTDDLTEFSVNTSWLNEKSVWDEL